MIGRPPVAPHVRFFRKCVEDSTTGCWIWQATLINGLYGQFFNGQKQVYAHRWAYEHLITEIPAGLQLDHLCRTTACVNPYHLEPVTPSVNTRRGTSPAAINAAKTRCVRGHDYTETNTLKVSDGRACHQCRLEDWKRFRDRKRASA